ncbi:hypothetical protein AAV94_01895 [Lampropedia cohaerens]|uniref:ABC transporter n=1 Tax=Lampropedia cohaerens TaxID=1610491 RepID=A0A0U1Q336_9BURK|nr:VacJ family lipoprotein [Lampropedia cohaerens]KKW69156.1 hypothetical protein AAV94_01895 [Lampropedia cohaerens]
MPTEPTRFSLPAPRALHLCAAMGTALTLAACSTTGPQGQQYGQTPGDPFESFNRSMYSLNEGLDRAILRPVATGYQTVVPELARKGVGNFFGNLGDVWSFANNVAQLKGEAAMSSFFRVAVNTTFGLGGLLDVASEMRLQRYKSDFGLTLAHWGVPSGPYLVLPLLGPSTVRDTAALPADIYGNPLSHLNPSEHRYGLRALNIVDTRARYLRASDLLDQAAFDPYVMVRDLYLQQRTGSTTGDGAVDEDGYIPDYDEEMGSGYVPEVDEAPLQ